MRSKVLYIKYVECLIFFKVYFYTNFFPWFALVQVGRRGQVGTFPKSHKWAKNATFGNLRCGDWPLKKLQMVGKVTPLAGNNVAFHMTQFWLVWKYKDMLSF